MDRTPKIQAKTNCPLKKNKKATINSIEDIIEELDKKARKEKEKRLTQQKIKNILRHSSSSIQFTQYIDMQSLYPLKPPHYPEAYVDELEQKNVPSAAMENGEENTPLADIPVDSYLAESAGNTMEIRSRISMQDYHFYTHILEHGLNVASYVHTLFLGLEPLHNLSSVWLQRLLLAAQYHDVGTIDEAKAHHKHSYQRIKSNKAILIPEKDREMVALLARYHRRAMPSEKHKEFACLSAKEQIHLSKAAALLRVADALDYRHQAIIKKIDICINKNTVYLECHCNKSLNQERDRVHRKGDLFRKIFQKEIECKQV